MPDYSRGRPLIRTLVLIAIGLAALAGCGTGPNTGPTPSATSATATTQTGQVTVTTDKSHYATTDPIAVVIHNNGGSAITVTNHHTQCTYVSLVQVTKGASATVRPCPPGSPIRLADLPPGDTSVRLLPGASSWPAGSYQVALEYFAGGNATAAPGAGAPVAPTSQPIVVNSATFTIG